MSKQHHQQSPMSDHFEVKLTLEMGCFDFLLLPKVRYVITVSRYDRGVLFGQLSIADIYDLTMNRNAHTFISSSSLLLGNRSNCMYSK